MASEANDSDRAYKRSHCKHANMRSGLNQLYSNINDLEMEVSGHTRVDGAIKPLDLSWHCYRLNGVLIEDYKGSLASISSQQREGETIFCSHERDV